MLHDCSKCKVTETCPITLIADWINNNEKEIGSAIHDCSDELSKSCAALCKAFPLAQLCLEDITHLAKTVFILGYQKGRVFPTVPEVFERGI